MRETEYRLALSQETFKPGQYTFSAVNKGTVVHALQVDGPGLRDRRIGGSLQPGASGSATVTLRKGTYRLYCPIDGHVKLGMKLTIEVR